MLLVSPPQALVRVVRVTRGSPVKWPSAGWTVWGRFPGSVVTFFSGTSYGVQILSTLDLSYIALKLYTVSIYVSFQL